MGSPAHLVRESDFGSRFLSDVVPVNPEPTMSRSVLFVQPPAYQVQAPPYPIALLAGFLEARESRVQVFDANLKLYLHASEEERQAWHYGQLFSWRDPGNVAEIIQRHEAWIDDNIVAPIIASRCDLIGMHACAESIHFACALARKLKAASPHQHVLFGGPEFPIEHMANQSKEALPADVVVFGPGEAALLNLVSATESEILELRREKFLAVSSATTPSDFAPPAYHLFDTENYLSQGQALYFMTSRGCVNRCCYCDEKRFWKTYRHMSPDAVLEQVNELLRQFPRLSHIQFSDSLVNASMPRLHRIAELFIEHASRPFTWRGSAAVRPEMTRAVFDELRRAGCTGLIFGVETASTPLLARIGKVLTRDSNLGAMVKDAYDAGLSCEYNFMFGLPGETEADFELLLQFIKDSGRYLPSVNPSYSCCVFSPATLTDAVKKQFDIEVPVYQYESGTGIRYDHWRIRSTDNTFLRRIERRRAFIETLQRYAPDADLNARAGESFREMVKEQVLEFETLQETCLVRWE